MVWGYINAKGVGFLDKVDGRLNAADYIDVLENFLIPTIDYHGLWQKLLNKGQPLNSRHRSMYQLVLYSEVPLYWPSMSWIYLLYRNIMAWYKFASFSVSNQPIIQCTI